MADSAFVRNVTTENFEAEVVQKSMETPILVDFWAPWCGPCQSLGPILEKLADEYAGAFILVKINTDEEQMLATQVGVRSLPTVVLIKQGQMADQFMGALPEGQVREFLNRHIEQPQLSVKEQAEALLANDQAEDAIGLLQQASQAEPDNHALKIMLAAALMQIGAAEQAKQIVEALPADQRDSEGAKAILARLQFADLIKDAPDISTLKSRVETDPNDLEARHLLGVRCLVASDSEAALEQFMAIMQQDRSYEDDLGRRTLVEAFGIIDDRALVNRYRQKMTSLLF